jgi:hypothetical protein
LTLMMLNFLLFDLGSTAGKVFVDGGLRVDDSLLF